jgi:recombinational DNA repair protein RecT
MDNKKNEATHAVAKANKGFSAIMMGRVDEIAQNSGSALSIKDKSFAQDIILSTYKRMIEEDIDPNDVNFIGCNFPGQVKRYTRLGLSLNENEIWLDIRNNSKAKKKDINIKIQYQGEEKLLTKFCQKNGGVINVIKDVIMEGEEVVTSRDFKTGNYVISDHKIPDILHRNINIANKENVIGAYAIAYHKDGTQTAIIIDKDRIERAMKSAQTKVIWNADYKKMVLKTVVHELYKELTKFNVIPDELLDDYHDMVLNKEEVQAEISANANKEVFEADFDIKDDQPPHQLEQDSSSPKFDMKTGEVLKEKEPAKQAQYAYQKELSEEEPF